MSTFSADEVRVVCRQCQKADWKTGHKALCCAPPQDVRVGDLVHVQSTSSRDDREPRGVCGLVLARICSGSGQEQEWLVVMIEGRVFTRDAALLRNYSSGTHEISKTGATSCVRNVAADTAAASPSQHIMPDIARLGMLSNVCATMRAFLERFAEHLESEKQFGALWTKFRAALAAFAEIPALEGMPACKAADPSHDLQAMCKQRQQWLARAGEVWTGVMAEAAATKC